MVDTINSSTDMNNDDNNNSFDDDKDFCVLLERQHAIMMMYITHVTYWCIFENTWKSYMVSTI